MKQVVKNILEVWQSNEASVLVSIINKSGSTPRGVGTLMLVGKDGLITGTVGGGQVEKDAIDMAINCLATRKSFSTKFELNLQDTTLNMVCGGSLYLYFLYMDKSLFYDEVVAINKKIDSEENGFMVLDTIENKLIFSAEAQASEGKVSIPLPVPDRVIIFGAGHVAKALISVLNSVGFACTVMDNREGFATKENLPEAKEVIYGDYEHLEDYIDIKPTDYIVIMTHGHSHDYVVLEKLLRKEQAYIGVMGSKRKKAFVNEKLKLAGILDDRIDSVHAPIGIPIGSVTPGEVAISIAAELIKTRFDRRK